MIREMMHEEDGATAIEYGLIAALISLASIVAFKSLGLNLADVFNTITLGKGHLSGELSDAEDAKELLKSVPSADVIATNALLMGLMGVIVICGSLSCLLGHGHDTRFKYTATLIHELSTWSGCTNSSYVKNSHQ